MPEANYFDKYDAPAAEGNYFDKYDPPKPQPAQKTQARSDEPPDILYKPIAGAVGAIPGLLERAGAHAKGLMTGEVPPTPENVLPAASMMVGASPVKLGLGAAAEAVPKVVPSMPGFVGGGAGMQIATQQLAKIPIVGAPIRKAAEKSLGEFESAADQALLMAAGKGGLPEGQIATAGSTGRFISGAARRAELGGAELPMWARTAATGRMSGESTLGHMLDAAKSAERADVIGLNRIKAGMSADEWAMSQGTLIQHMGRVGDKWSPTELIRNYNELSPAGRNILFGTPQQGGALRVHFDSLAADTAKIEALRDIPTKSNRAYGAALLGFGVVEPMSALTTVLGARSVASAISKPETAAPLAQWSRAFTRFVEQGRSPASIGALQIATRNLENSLGEKIDPKKLAEALSPISSAEAAPRSIADQNKPLPEEEEARRRIRERIEGTDRRSFLEQLNPISSAQAMTPESERRNPRPGRVQQEGGGGGFEPKLRERSLEELFGSYTQGKISGSELQLMLKKSHPGWTIDLRKGSRRLSDFEIFDPSGKAHYIQP